MKEVKIIKSDIESLNLNKKLRSVKAIYIPLSGLCAKSLSTVSPKTYSPVNIIFIHVIFLGSGNFPTRSKNL